MFFSERLSFKVVQAGSMIQLLMTSSLRKHLQWPFAISLLYLRLSVVGKLFSGKECKQTLHHQSNQHHEEGQVSWSP